MSREHSLDDVVTEFMLQTCRLRPQQTLEALRAALYSGVTDRQKAIEDDDHIPLTTGSVAEFYIDPILPLVGDIDVMHYWNTALAIPRGHSPPTQLPAEFHNYVKVAEIIDNHLPGYVYLKLRYLLTQCNYDGKYNSVECKRRQYAVNI